MKTLQEIQSKIKALESQLDFVLRQRDECKSTHTYLLKVELDKSYVQRHCDGYNKGFRTCLDIYTSK